MRPWHHLNIVTPFLRLGVLLNDVENVNVVQLGGTVHKKSLSVLGSETTRDWKTASVRSSFSGVDGIDLEHGITTSTIEEAQLTRRMMASGLEDDRALADSTKFGQRGFGRIGSLEDVDVIVTDGEGLRADGCGARRGRRGPDRRQIPAGGELGWAGLDWAALKLHWWGWFRIQPYAQAKRGTLYPIPIYAMETSDQKRMKRLLNSSTDVESDASNSDFYPSSGAAFPVFRSKRRSPRSIGSPTRRSLGVERPHHPRRTLRLRKILQPQGGIRQPRMAARLGQLPALAAAGTQRRSGGSGRCGPANHSG